jgi:hypothetical protein
MLLKYARKQRASIYHSATIDDLPFEVLREAFLYLKLKDLVSPSRVNRSWRPAAQDVQRAQLKIARWERGRMDVSSLCGIQLTRIVFGSEAYSIKHLNLDLGLLDGEHIHILAQLVSTALRTLELSFYDSGGSVVHYAILDQFFSQCNGIRNLNLQDFDFGENPASISQTIKTGFYQLSQLSLCRCEGDLRMFVVSVPIPNLQSFSNEYFGGIGISAVAINYPSIKRLRLDDYYSSSATLLKFVECCRFIEELSFCESSGDDLKLNHSDIESITSLPRLKSLNINCLITDDDVSVLSRCKGLMHLDLWPGSSALKNILPSIGRNLVSLEYDSSTPFLETVNRIIEYCPKLKMFDVRCEELDTETKAADLDLLKRGLKNLSEFKVDGISIRLGTDWEGY